MQAMSKKKEKRCAVARSALLKFSLKSFRGFDTNNSVNATTNQFLILKKSESLTFSINIYIDHTQKIIKLYDVSYCTHTHRIVRSKKIIEFRFETESRERKTRRFLLSLRLSL